MQAASNDRNQQSQFLDENAYPTSISIVSSIFREYHDRPALVSCAPWLPTSEYKAVTYGEVWLKVQEVAAGLKALDIVKQAGEFMGICGFSSADWCIAEWSLLYLGITMVPIPLNVSLEDMAFILGKGGMNSLFVSVEELHSPTVMGAIKTTPAIHTLIVMDSFGNAEYLAEGLSLPHIKELQENHNMVIVPLGKVVEAGRSSKPFPPLMFVPGEDGNEKNPIISLMYTSGSTGLPKGACLHESIEVIYWRTGPKQRQATFDIPQIVLSYMPLNHAGGRLGIRAALSVGGLVYFLRKSDMSTFMEDLKVARPTNILLVPRVANMLYESYQNAVAKVPPGLTREEHERREKRRLRDEVMGGRLMLAVVGTGE